MIRSSILNRPFSFFLPLLVFVYLVVMILNDGFMALDEYWVGITRYIPAQSSSLKTLVTADDVKSPLQMMPMHGVAQLALNLGVTSPYAQYRCVIAALGLFSLALMIFAFLEFAKVMNFDHRARNFLFLILTFYFGASFALTRPMYESISAPWLTLAAVWALRYDFHGRLNDLVWGVIFASITFILRQQLGICALVFIALTMMKKNKKHFLIASAVGLAIFILSGIPDYYLRGQFHFSLLNLTIYNYQHGADYGRKPITFYPLLILAMTFFPFLIAKYPKEWMQVQFKSYRTVWIILFLFVFLHSLFPQKWERFLISVIPILIFLVFPFLFYLHERFAQHRLRLVSLYSLNGILFFVASFFPPQKNLIEMSLYLNKHPSIRTIYRVNDTPGWITEAFVLDKKFSFVETTPEELAKIDFNNFSDCGKALVLATHDLEANKEVIQKLNLQVQFNVNLIEQVAYKLNPKNNARRVQLNLYTGCRIVRLESK